MVHGALLRILGAVLALALQLSARRLLVARLLQQVVHSRTTIGTTRRTRRRRHSQPHHGRLWWYLYLAKFDEFFVFLISESYR
jgi:hypothetical protein